MPEEVDFLVEDRIIRVRSYGRTKIPEMEASLAKVKELVDEKGVRNLLVDAQKLISMPDTFKIFDFMSTLPLDLRLAVVISPETSKEAESDLQFAETVARNRGRRFRVFGDHASALTWLKEG